MLHVLVQLLHNIFYVYVSELRENNLQIKECVIFK